MHNVELLINGQLWSGWQKIRFNRSIKSAANWFDLSLTDKWDYASRSMPINKGDSCQLLVDGNITLTGYIFDVLPSYEAENHTINIGGFSKAKDLVDCSTTGKQFSGRTLLQIAQTLCEPFGINVTAGADIGAAFPTVVIEPGESIFEFLNKLSRLRAVRIVSLPDGSISFVQTGTRVSPTSLVFGKNILKCNAHFSAEGDFSSVTVLGQTPGTDTEYGDSAALNKSTATNANVRYRPLVINADGPADNADCKIRAQAEMNRLAGECQGILYMVQDWYNALSLWDANVLIDIYDPFINVNDRLLITQVNFDVDIQMGFITTIEVQPAAAFDLKPLSIDQIPDQIKVKSTKSKRHGTH